MEKKQKTNLGTENIKNLLFRLSIPAITAQLINALYNIVDRMYIGHIKDIGALALTGVGICFPLIMLISAFTSLISMGGAPLASINMGKNDTDTAENILGNCLSSLFICGIVLMLIYLGFSEKILLLFGASDETIIYSKNYMNIYIWGTIFVQFSLGLNMFITTQGFAKTSMLTVLIGAIINIILDPILIFGFNLGVSGGALATVLSQFISAIWVLYFLLGKKTILKIKAKYLKIKPAIILPAIGLGVSPFIMQSTESLLTLSFNSSLLKYDGNIAVGTMTILSSIMQFAMLPLQGLTQGAQPIVSYNYGAGNKDRVKNAFLLLFKISLLYTSIIWILVMLLPKAFAGIFTSNQELINYSVWAMRIFFSMIFLMGGQISCQQTFIALSNAKTSAFLALLRKLILLIPLIFILPLFFSNKAFAVFLAEPIADTIAVIITMTMFFKSFKKNGFI